MYGFEDVFEDLRHVLKCIPMLTQTRTVPIRFLVSKGADVGAVNREGKTTVDMANGPVQRVQPWPETIKYLESLGAKNNHRCLSC